MLRIFVIIFLFFLLSGCQESPTPLQHDITDSMPAQNNLDNKLLAWGFKREQGQAPSVPSNIESLLKQYDGYYLGNTEEKVLYLTFDEGYENGYTNAILDVLNKTQVPAAFFVTGPYLQKEEAIIRRMVNEGHIVGNHTINHPSMPSVTDMNKLKQELTGLSDMFSAKYGGEMKFFRPPMGEYSENVLSVCQSLGYKTVFWSSAYVDWDVKKQPDEKIAYEKITSQFHNGSIILLHAVSKTNAQVLEQVINAAKEQGYRFCSLAELE